MFTLQERIWLNEDGKNWCKGFEKVWIRDSVLEWQEVFSNDFNSFAESTLFDSYQGAEREDTGVYISG